MRNAVSALIALIVGAVALGGAAQAHDPMTPPAEQRIIPWDGVLPTCDNPRVLDRVQKRFQQRESRFWNNPSRIVSYEKVRRVAYRPWGASFIPRLYCSAVAHVDDGKRVRAHRVAYVVRDDLGFAGYGWDVEWCVVGYERHRHAAPECRMLAP